GASTLDGEADRPGSAVDLTDHQDVAAGTANPGDAARAVVPDPAGAGDEVGSISNPSGDSTADQPEREDEGVRTPAPAPKREETEEEQARREEREFREARSLDFATGLVSVKMRLEPDPIRWFQTVYLRGVYHARDLPRVRECFTPAGLRQAAEQLLTLPEYMEETREEL